MKQKLLLSFFLLFSFVVIQAQHVVKGKITDAKDEPLIGVNVVEKGTNNSNGTTTDIDGNFELEVASSNSVLLLKYIGFEDQEVKIDGRSQLNAILKDGLTLGEVQVVGSRSQNRSATKSPAPIDIIDISEIANQTGKVEINQMLQYAAPSFNATKQSGSDGADHVDPASLRGLGPDQTLVLVNGKRRHQSSLVNIFGTRGRGNSGTDLNAIPASAIKRIEVLRDGASAQYGSDAIAGVINIVLKDKTDGVSGGITYGGYSTAVGANFEDEYGDALFNVDGKQRVLDPDDNGNPGEAAFDGLTTKVDLNYGAALGNKGGFVNFTSEYLTKQRTLRPGFSWRKGYGSAAVDQFQFMVNGAMPLSENTELYVFGGIGDRDTDAFAFSRDGEGDSRSVPSLYPNGFTPRITSVIKDNSITAGVRNELENGWRTDFSHTYGSNNFHYFIKGSNNASMGAASPTDFDAGGHSLGMNVTGMDFSKFFENTLNGLNIAFGAEYRSENFKIFAGETASYATYDVNGIPLIDPSTQEAVLDENEEAIPGGSQGFPGYSPANEVDRNRSNIGFYGDVELNITEDLLATGAVRYENYSDFGNTLNYKLAARYSILDGLSARASISSGFRAPSLAQIYYNLLFNNIVGGRSERTLLVPNTDSGKFGIQTLTEEKANNIAAGITFKKSGFTATVDYYNITVDDRIVLTDVFDANDLGIDPSANVDAAQFFANGIDTKTTGIDFVLSYKLGLSNMNANAVTIGVAGNINNTEIERINSGNLNEITFFGPFSQAYVEAAAPDYKIGVNLGTTLGPLDVQVNYTYFSEVILQDFQWVDSPPTDETGVQELYDVATDVYEAAGSLDASVSYQINDNFRLTVGGNNLLNTYPTPQFDGWTDQGGFNDSVQMGSDGLYLFGRIGFNF